MTHRDSDIEVSVIVLSFNQADTIGRTLDSVLCQQCRFRYEIVVSDDASSDATRAVAEEYAAAHPDVIRLLPAGQRRGLVDNYFYALSQCRGRFIADCAADDYWLNSSSLQRKYDRLVADETLSIVCSDWRVFVEGEPQPPKPECDIEKARVRRLDGRSLLASELACVKGTVVHISTALYRRAFLDEALESIPEMVHDVTMGCEDLPVKAALLVRGDVEWISAETLCYCIGGVSVSSPGKASSIVEFQLQTADAVARLADYYGVSRDAVELNLRDKIGYAMSVAFAVRDYRNVKKADDVRRRLSIRLGAKHRVMAWLSHMLG